MKKVMHEMKTFIEMRVGPMARHNWIIPWINLLKNLLESMASNTWPNMYGLNKQTNKHSYWGPKLAHKKLQYAYI